MCCFTSRAIWGWSILANLTSRSTVLTTELRKVWFMLDTNDISIRAARYDIRTPTNIWADRLAREIDNDNWAAFNLRHFNYLDSTWGRHIIDRFATAKDNARVPRCDTTRWRDPCMVVFPPSMDIFAPGRLGVRGGVGPPKWPVVAFRLPLLARGKRRNDHDCDGSGNNRDYFKTTRPTREAAAARTAKDTAKDIGKGKTKVAG
eukprot:jgi/Tetstr1/454886/TSEL_041750.t1